MIYATFTEEMLEIIKGVINSEFISYECYSHEIKRGYPESPYAPYGSLRVNTDKYTIDFENQEKTFPIYYGKEDIACLSCKVGNPNEALKAYTIGEEHRKIDVQDKIIGVEIITDYIDVDSGMYDIAIDRAVVFETQKEKIMFWRDIWFSESINISYHDSYDLLYPIQEVIDAWSNEGENKVTVKRVAREL